MHFPFQQNTENEFHFENNFLGFVQVEYSDVSAEYFVRNRVAYSKPTVLHADGADKALLSNFESCVVGGTKHKEFEACEAKKLEDLEKENLPKVTLAINIPKAVPFLEEFFQKILALEYPKDKLSLFIYNDVSVVA